MGVDLMEAIARRQRQIRQFRAPGPSRSDSPPPRTRASRYVAAMSGEQAGGLGVLRRVKRGVGRYGYAAFAREVATRPLRPRLAPVAARKLRRRAARAQGLDELIDLAYGFDSFGTQIRPGQSRFEIRALLEALREQPPSRILEIGTARGGSLFLFAQLAAPAAHVISVDLPHGEFGGGYPEWKTPLYEAFARPGQRLDLIRADSHAASTVDHVRGLLGGAPLDFLFIDGDHEYDGVRADFEAYSALVRPGGLVGLHDITPPDPAAVVPPDSPEYLVGEVPRFWREIAPRHESREIVDPAALGFYGIGLVRL
jgi:predicted O-methyltransferase YrrM